MQALSFAPRGEWAGQLVGAVGSAHPQRQPALPFAVGRTGTEGTVVVLGARSPRPTTGEPSLAAAAPEEKARQALQDGGAASSLLPRAPIASPART